MATLDSDLRSIQQARDLVVAARDAQRKWAKATQAEVDRVCAAMADAAYRASERLGRMANEETGYGVPTHKMLKNHLSSRVLWEYIKDIKTVGVVRHDPARKLYGIAWPMGVIAALIPSTNPTSTAMYKSIIAVKARNAIVIAPHPAAIQCTAETARVVAEAAVSAGAPEGLIGCITHVTLPGTQELMKHRYTGLILATGGTPMVRAAHSVGKPAYGVGPGNVPCYVDRSANVERAARYIVASKAFDHSVICATEQAVVADRPIADKLARLMQAQGAYFVDESQANALRRALFTPGGGINTASVGQSPQSLAKLAGINVPDWARILVARLDKVGPEEPLSREKLTTVLGWYEVDGWEAGCDISLAMIHFGGRGHSQIIHAEDMDVIMAFGLEKPAFRIVVNTMGTLGTTGLTTGVPPAMTLGSGGFGGSITGDNISVEHLFNIKKLAFETTPPPELAMHGERPVAVPMAHQSSGPNGTSGGQPAASGPSDAEIERIVAQVLQELGA